MDAVDGWGVGFDAHFFCEVGVFLIIVGSGFSEDGAAFEGPVFLGISELVEVLGDVEGGA